MSKRSLVLALVVLGVVGCGESHSPLDGSNPDGGAQPDGGGPGDGGPDDGGPLPDGAPPDASPIDAGPRDAGPPEPCDTPGANEAVACGSCGTVDRFCTASGVWAYGTCEAEGVCAPGTLGSLECGDCGTQSARCTAACVWESTGECTAEGECTPGERETTSAGCPAGQTHDVVCNDSCAFVEETACVMDGCSPPGALETVACGTMCGTRDRFCTAEGVWEYDACGGEGVCVPGTMGTTSCGMCGTRPTRCDSECNVSPTGTCTGEGVCAPGTTMRTSTGCPAGQTRIATCNSSCAFGSGGTCTSTRPVDVILLLDTTGSLGGSIGTSRPIFNDRLIAPLVALGDVAVGIAYYADFPFSGYGSSGDRPFVGGIQPTTTAGPVEAELLTYSASGGGDGPESGIEALSILSGGAAPSSAVPITCTAGRTAGGCWRAGAERVVILYTDALQHNGPDPSGSGLYDPYSGISPAPATWTTVRVAMMGDGLELIPLMASSTPTAQHAEMLSDLGQPASNLRSAAGATELGTACDAAVERVRVIGGY